MYLVHKLIYLGFENSFYKCEPNPFISFSIAGITRNWLPFSSRFISTDGWTETTEGLKIWEGVVIWGHLIEQVLLINLLKSIGGAITPLVPSPSSAVPPSLMTLRKLSWAFRLFSLFSLLDHDQTNQYGRKAYIKHSIN